MLAVIGIPALDACRGDSRGTLDCLRGQVNDKLGTDPEPAVPPSEPEGASEVPATDPAPAAPVATAEAVITNEPVPVDAAPADDGELVADVTDANPVPKSPAAPAVPPPASSRSLTVPPPEKPPAPALATPPELATPELPIAEDQPAEPVVTEPIEPAADTTQPESPASPALLATTDLSPAESTPSEPPSSTIDEALADSPSEPAVAAGPAPKALTVPAWISTPSLEMQPPAMPAEEATPLVAIDASADASQPAEQQPIAEPPPEVASIVPPDQEAPAPPKTAVAAVDPLVQPVPEAPPTKAVALPPTIDAVEIDGDGNFIAGNGPDGATMRLYIDGIPAGVSPAEGGRWLVEGTGLLTEPRHTLKVEALDPLSGRVIADATVDFERPEPLTPDAPVPAEPAPAEPVSAPSDPAAPPDTLVLQGAEAAPLPAPADPIDEPRIAADIAEGVAPAPPPIPPQIPPIAPVVPAAETESVTILGADDVQEPATLPPAGDMSTPSVITLGTAVLPPATIARFIVPQPAVTKDVTVLKAVPIGDPGAGRFVSGKAIIRRGDTLWAIAHRYYGRGIHYRTIFRANRDLIARPGRIYPGQVFDLPLVYDD
jgi:nucleoid-associated protein YgaU